jgi:hypothetical protein
MFSTPLRLLAGREADRFRRRHLGVALADDLGPAADDRRLDKAEAAEGDPAGAADQLAGRTGAAAAWGAASILLS